MLNLLIPVDASACSNRAVVHAIQFCENSKTPVEIHLLNVQLALPYGGGVKKFISQDTINEYYEELGLEALAPARALLDQAGASYTYHIRIGAIGEVIAAYVREKDCQQIVMGSRGHSHMTGMLLGSVTMKVIHLVDVPVTLVK